MSFRTKGLGVIAAASIAVATPTIATWEGFRGQPYKDIGGVWTVCYGETENIDINRTYTKEECDAMLAKRVPDYYNGAMKHIDKDIPITMRAALTSFNYNVGEGNFSRSTLVKKVNRGDLLGACKELTKWSYVGKMWVKGLNNRRKAEYRLCTAELPAEV